MKLFYNPDLRERDLHLHVLQLLLERARTSSARPCSQEHPNDHLHAGGDGEAGRLMLY